AFLVNTLSFKKLALSIIKDNEKYNEIKLLDSYVKTVIDSNVKATQDKIVQEISSLNQQIGEKSQLLTQWQKEYVNYFKTNDEDGGYQLSEPGVNIKMLVLGFILGIVLSVVIYVIKDALSMKVRNKNDILNIYGISFISEIKCKRNDKNRTVNNEEQEDYIITLIKKKCNKDNSLEVYFIGSVMGRINTDIFDRIVEKLNKEGIKAKLLSNPCNDKNSLEQLNSGGVAILVEKVKVSRYDEIEKEIKLLYDNDVTILGAVIL
ncbi:MAG: hypothetical protein UF228_08425, partial [Lachnospiraceae bacterium]|nr:hypothetical protein [Lachnospiraceae bacterium]